MSTYTTQVSISGAGWTNIGTSPCTVELLSPGAGVQIVAADSEPTGAAAGWVLASALNQTTVDITETTTVWALLLNGLSANVSVMTQSASTGTTGTTGHDYSANQPAIPVVGQPFGTTGIYANYVLLTTVPASLARNNVEVLNPSGAQIIAVLDDGTAASGSAPNNATIVPLGGGSGAGAQGGDWSDQTFKGRLQIYAPSALAFVSARVT
jgi:hypothetical protein